MRRHFKTPLVDMMAIIAMCIVLVAIWARGEYRRQIASIQWPGHAASSMYTSNPDSTLEFLRCDIDDETTEAE